MRFRRITIEDADRLVDFYNGLSQASIRTFCPLGKQTTREVVDKIILDNKHWVNKKYDLVIVDDGKVVGWSFIWELKQKEPVFGLAVADAYHHQGLGKQLIKRVMNWADKHQIPQVFLTVVQDNQVAWRLYEKYGFVKYGEMIGENDGLPYFKMAAHPPYVHQD